MRKRRRGIRERERRRGGGGGEEDDLQPGILISGSTVPSRLHDLSVYLKDGWATAAAARATRPASATPIDLDMSILFAVAGLSPVMCWGVVLGRAEERIEGGGMRGGWKTKKKGRL